MNQDVLISLVFSVAGGILAFAGYLFFRRVGLAISRIRAFARARRSSKSVDVAPPVVEEPPLKRLEQAPVDGPPAAVQNPDDGLSAAISSIASAQISIIERLDGLSAPTEVPTPDPSEIAAKLSSLIAEHIDPLKASVAAMAAAEPPAPIDTTGDLRALDDRMSAMSAALDKAAVQQTSDIAQLRIEIGEIAASKGDGPDVAGDIDA